MEVVPSKRALKRSLVGDEYLTFVSLLVAVTAAPITAEPDGSVTLPTMMPSVAWPKLSPAKQTIPTTTAVKRLRIVPSSTTPRTCLLDMWAPTLHSRGHLSRLS